MELHVLRYFITVVDEGNISSAAQKLQISQPTISRQLTNLEDELNTTLFIRGNRAITLTPAGKYFSDKARQIIDLAEKAKINIHQNADMYGEITIGCAESPMFKYVAQTIKKFQTTHPNIQFNLLSTDATTTFNKVDNGLYDFGIVMNPSNKDDYNFIVLPGQTQWGILTNKNNDLAKNKTIQPNQLENQKLILPLTNYQLSTFNDWFGQNNVNYQVIAHYNLINNAANLAMTGIGHVLCLEGVFNTTNTNLTFIPLAPTINTTASFVWSKNTQLSTASNAFLTCIHNELLAK